MDYCPKCAMPTYVSGVCLNNDCNFPSIESNNEKARKRAREEAERRALAEQEARDRAAREQREREAEERRKQEKAAKEAQEAVARVKSSTDWSWIAAIVAFFIGVGVASGSWNFEGGAVWVIGGIAAAIGGLFYKQILGLAVLVLIAIVFFSYLADESRKKQESAQTPPAFVDPSGTPVPPAGPATPPAPLPGDWGAIAYSPSSQYSGWTANYANVDEAVRDALAYCAQHASDCQWAVKFVRGCGSVVASGRQWNGEYGGTADEATAKALALCEQAGEPCRLIISKCTG